MREKNHKIIKESRYEKKGRKVLSILLSLMMVLSLLPMGFASAEGDAIITVGSIDAEAGTTEVILPVTIQNNPGFNAFSFVVDYNKTALTLTDVILSNTDSECLLRNENMIKTIPNNQMGYSYPSYTDDFTENGVLFKLKFSVNEPVEDSVVSLKLFNNDPGNFASIVTMAAVPVTFVAGTVTVPAVQPVPTQQMVTFIAEPEGGFDPEELQAFVSAEKLAYINITGEEELQLCFEAHTGEVAVAYPLYSGDYEYVFTADGYEDVTGGFTVADEELTVRITIVAEGDPEPVYTLSGGETITAGGTYTLLAGAAGVITINTTEPVTIVGLGLNYPFNTLSIDSAIADVKLSVQDLAILNPSSGGNVINFLSGNNTLTIAGVNLLENHLGGGGAKALVRVPAGSSLTVNGNGTLYFYKDSGGAGFGGDNGNACGNMIFDGPTIFGKGTRQGAVIGVGASVQSGVTPGDITFLSGEYVLIGNATGAIIGGSGGSGGGTGGNVYVKGGILTLNVDWSGAAIGGGGYSGGENSSGGGNLYITGGSIRTYIDTNAKGTWGVQGVSDVAISAKKQNASGDAVYLFTFDTNMLADTATAFAVSIDGKAYYSGGLHKYSFVNENTEKDGQTPISDTTTNWRPLDDSNLYLYMTEGSHKIIANGEEFNVEWDEDTKTFSITEPEPVDPTVWDGTIDTSWYNPEDTEFTLTTAAQFAGFAVIVNNKPETSAAGAVTGTDPAIPADDFSGKTVVLAADLDLGGVEVTRGGLSGTVYTTPVWEGQEWTPIASYSGATPSANGAAGRPFKGTFDGGLHSISNIYVPGNPSAGFDSPLTNSHALFGDLGHDGIVKNVIISSGYIRGARFTGGVVGRNWGIIESCANYATVETDGSRSGGGIAGVSYENTPGDGHTPTIRNCYNAGLIMMGDQYRPGGIVSDNEGLVENCYNIGYGRHKSNGNNMAGIVGGGRAAGTTVNSYSLAGEGMPTAISGTTIPNGCAILSEEVMKSAEFVNMLGGAFIADTETVNGGYPVLRTAPEPEPDLSGPWDGTIDVRWYNTTDTVFHIKTAAELAGLAAIVNGIYNKGAKVIGDDDHTKIVATRSENGETSGGTFHPYHYGSDDFNGKTIYIDNDLDMGGVKNGSTWSGPNYMPIGGQYMMDLTDGDTMLSSSFNGTFDGQGHKIYNIYCERAAMEFGYDMSQSVGLIGRLGVHDNDPHEIRATNPTVRNVVVDGYISSRRSVGGIVGKMGKTTYNSSPRPEGAIGGIIENCANYASVYGTDAKGTGGIVGAGWNGGIIRNCYNAGYVRNTYNAIAGIAGSNEVRIENCYNAGTVYAGSSSAAAIASNNGGGSYVNDYWLEGSADVGNYGSPALPADAKKTAEEMRAPEFVDLLNGTGRAYVMAPEGVNDGFPILRVTLGPDTSVLTEIVKTSDPAKLSYEVGEKFDATGLALRAVYSDGSSVAVTAYTISNTDVLTPEDTQITISGTYDGMEFSFTIGITVSNHKLDGLTIVTQPTNTKYAVGEAFDPTGLVVRATYADGTNATLENSACTYSPEVIAADTTVITVSYTEGGVTKTADISITVADGFKVPETDENGTFLIGTPGELLWFANQVSTGKNPTANAILTADIDTTQSGAWTPIGTTGASRQYKGIFDGDGHSVTLNATGTSNFGLFGYAGAGAVIKNLTVSGKVSGTNSVGGIAGFADGAAFYNVVNNAEVTGTSYYIGGIIGNSSKITIENAVNNGKISSTAYYGVGGIVGVVRDAPVLKDLYNNGEISGTYNIAGIIGTISGETGNTAPIDGAYNSGTITGTYSVGGIVGSISNFGGATVNNAENSGSVTGTYNVGGIIGNAANNGAISNVTNSGAVTATSTAPTPAYGVGGIIGYLTATAGPNLTNATNNGTVLGGVLNVGGIVGYLYNGGVTSSTNNGAVTSTATDDTARVGGIVGRSNNMSATVSGNKNNGKVSFTASNSTDIGGVIGYAAGITNVLGNTYKSGTAAKAIGNMAYTDENATVTDVYGVFTELSAASLNAGETFTVDVYVDGADDFAALDVTVEYDAGYLTLMDKTSYMDGINLWNTGTAGKAGLARSGDDITITGAYKAMTLTFTVKSSGFTGSQSAQIAITKAQIGASGDSKDAPDATKSAPETVDVHNITVTFAAGAGVDMTGATAYAKYGVAGLYTDNTYLEACVITTPVATQGFELKSPVWSDGTSGFTAAEINAMAFTGNTVFTAQATKLTYSITLPQEATDVTGVENGEATYGTDVTFKLPLDEVEGYTVIVYYTVDGGERIELTAENGVYTIPGTDIIGEIVVDYTYVVEGTVILWDSETFNANPEGYQLMLFIVESVIPDVTYLFDGEAMFWSGKYPPEADKPGAFVFFIDADMTAEEALALISIDATGTKTENVGVEYDGDVNGSNTVSIGDAQIAYDLYKQHPNYKTLGGLGALMRLEADVNGDGYVDTNDVRAIHAIILGITTP